MSEPRDNETIILDSWRRNAAAWTRAVRQGEIESRQSVTDRAILKVIDSLQPRRVLDVGCGEGWLSHRLGRDGLCVVGIDAVPELIHRARELDSARFILAPYEELAHGRLIMDPFHLAVCNFSLLGETSVAQLLPGLHHYLVAQGHLVIQTLHPQALHLVSASADPPDTDGWRQGSWEGFGPDFTDPAPWYFRTRDSWLRLLEQSGFAMESLLEPACENKAPISIIFVARRAAGSPPNPD